MDFFEEEDFVNEEEIEMLEINEDIPLYSYSWWVSLKKVVIGEGVTTIESGAFSDCYSLAEVELPNSLKILGKLAFDSCSDLQRINIPSNVEEIEEFTFRGCLKLEEVILNEGLTAIRDFAFQECYALRSITLPASVNSVGEGVFQYCRSLDGIYVSEDNKEYCSEDGVLFSKDNSKLVEYPGGKTSNYKIPESVNTICCRAFAKVNKLNEVVFPPKLKDIENNAFFGSSITRAHLPKSTEIIGSYAFGRCMHLESLTIPASIQDILPNAFVHCNNLKYVTVLRTNTEIDYTNLAKLLSKRLNECTSLKKIYAPDISVSMFSSKLKEVAVCGIAELKLKGEYISDEVYKDCLRYIKLRKKNLYKRLLEEDFLFRLMITENLIPKKDIPILIELFNKESRTDLTVEIIEYSTKLK